MSGKQVEISEVLGTLHQVAPAGYAIGLQITYTTPKFMFQSYRSDWLSYYSQNGLLMRDPTLAWGFENTGIVRWNDLREQDTMGVLDEAAKFDINYGVTCARESANKDGVRSIGSFARSDRDFAEEELAQILSLFNQLHDNTEDKAQLSESTIQQLKKMSIMVTHPGS